MMSFTKMEVYNVLQQCKRRVKPWRQAACTENLVKFGRMIPEICERKDTQTHTHTHTQTLVDL